MKILMMDFKGDAGRLIDLALRAQNSDHKIRYWMHDSNSIGIGLIDRVNEWKPSMNWADLIILSGNCDYPPSFSEHFGRGYPIFGTNPKAAELELDRAKGQEILKRYGIPTLPYTVVSSAAKGIEFLVKNNQPYCIKPWGGATDKSTTCVPSTVEDAIFTLQKWDREGLVKGELMLQEMIEGIEIGVSRFFGPSGWSLPIEESFEFKKFLNDDLGGNTGEMGTVIRHVRSSRLFDLLLEPLSDYLHLCHFVGDCSVNAIIDANGQPWPLEFTVRLGWPDFCIRQEVIQRDPVEWMAALLQGEDSLEVSSETALGIVMAHGDFPKERDHPDKWSGFPITVEDGQEQHVHWQQVMDDEIPVVVGKHLKMSRGMVSAGQYVCVVSGCGPSVIAAHMAANAAAEAVKWPSNILRRTDIGKRLKNQLPVLQSFGFAEGMRYG
jgi:phosphoribosylamine---glycine ligase